MQLRCPILNGSPVPFHRQEIQPPELQAAIFPAKPAKFSILCPALPCHRRPPVFPALISGPVPYIFPVSFLLCVPAFPHKILPDLVAFLPDLPVILSYHLYILPEFFSHMFPFFLLPCRFFHPPSDMIPDPRSQSSPFLLL